MKIIYHPNPADVLQAARNALHNFLVAEKERSRLVLLSGGSAFDLLDNFPRDAHPENMTIGVLDERFSTDPLVNNFSQLSHTQWFRDSIESGARFIDTSVHDDELLDACAWRFELSLRTWRTTHPEGTIIATMGIGPDGHTAGIMPYPEDSRTFQKLFDDERVWVRGYDAGAKNQYPLRMTTTLALLRNVDDAVVYVCGKQKEDALLRIMSGYGTLWETPARIMREMKHIGVYTDINAFRGF